MHSILIPGLMNDGWVWQGQIGPLSRLGPVTVANNDGCDSLAAMAERALAATDGPVAVIGHSMGGRVALEAAAQAPDRVRRLVLLDTGAGGPSAAERPGRMKLVDLARAQGMRAVCDAWLPPMLAPALRGDAALVRGIEAMLDRCTPDIFAAQQKALLERTERVPLLPKLGCKVLVATGSEDEWASPRQHAEMAAAIPQATLRIVSGAGHMLPLEKPDLLADLLVRWLAG